MTGVAKRDALNLQPDRYERWLFIRYPQFCCMFVQHQCRLNALIRIVSGAKLVR